MSNNSSFQDLGGQRSLQILRRTSSDQSQSFIQKPTQTTFDFVQRQNLKEQSIHEENELLLSQNQINPVEDQNEGEKSQVSSNLTHQADKVLLEFCDPNGQQGTKRVLIAHETDSENELEELEGQVSQKIYVPDEKQIKPAARYIPTIQKPMKQILTNKREQLLEILTLKQKKIQDTIPAKQQRETVKEKTFNDVPIQRKFVIACQRRTVEQEQRKRVIEKRQKMVKIVNQNTIQEKMSQQNTGKKESFTPLEFDQFFKSCRYQQGKIQCPGGFKATNVCVEKNCDKCSYQCSESQCRVCSAAHQDCSLKFTIEMLAKTLNKNLERQKTLAKQIFDFGSSIIEEVTLNRKILSKYLCFQGLDINNFKDQLLQDKQVDLKSCQILDLLDTFKKEESNEAYKLEVLRKKMTCDSQSIKYTLDNGVNFLLKPLKLQEQVANIPTRLVTNQSQIKFILQSLNYPADFTLLYRASQHEFNLNKFHRRVDDIEHTFTIIKTQNDKLIGAYTPLKIKNNKMGRDRSNKTFLLAINLKEKLEHIRNGQCAVYYNKDFGPAFGGLFQKRDIEIVEENGQLQCITNFPNTFNWKKQFLPCQESWRFLTGVSLGRKCRVVDFEVFRIKFRE